MAALDSSTIIQSHIDRFMSYVLVDPITKAWIWQGGITGSGYGGFWHNGRAVAAHRFAWAAFKGSIPEGMVVCHKFENLGRHNVNPDQMFLGTLTDNMQDASEKDRTLKGESNHQSVLTAKQAVEIYRSDETYKVLSGLYGVSDVIIGKIKRGELWTCATGASPASTHNLKNKTGYPGVRLKKGGYEASIGWRENGCYRSRYLGRYKTPEAAHDAYLAEKQRLSE